jgi:hypothetical protein
VAARYSSTVCGAAGFKACFGAAFFGARGLVAGFFKALVRFVVEDRLDDFAFFMS